MQTICRFLKIDSRKGICIIDIDMRYRLSGAQLILILKSSIPNKTIRFNRYLHECHSTGSSIND